MRFFLLFIAWVFSRNDKSLFFITIPLLFALLPSFRSFVLSSQRYGNNFSGMKINNHKTRKFVVNIVFFAGLNYINKMVLLVLQILELLLIRGRKLCWYNIWYICVFVLLVQISIPWNPWIPSMMNKNSRFCVYCRQMLFDKLEVFKFVWKCCCRK